MESFFGGKNPGHTLMLAIVISQANTSLLFAFNLRFHIISGVASIIF